MRLEMAGPPADTATLAGQGAGLCWGQQSQQAKMAGGVEKDKHIREVWADNLEEEMEIMRNLIDDYPYLSMVRAAAAAEVFRGRRG